MYYTTTKISFTLVHFNTRYTVVTYSSVELILRSLSPRYPMFCFLDTRSNYKITY